jgi:hypothetical protein
LHAKRLYVLEVCKVSSIICLFALIWWAGNVHAKICVGDLQGAFHHLFMYLHLSGGLGMYMQKNLCVGDLQGTKTEQLFRTVSHPTPSLNSLPLLSILLPNHRTMNGMTLGRIRGRGGACERHCTPLNTSTVTTDSFYKL